MKFRPILFLALLIPLMAVSEDTRPEIDAVGEVIDDFHDAAAHGDRERYLGHLTDDAVYLGTEDKGVYASLDSGGTWMAFNQGLEGLSIQALEVSTSQPKMLYAGLEYGGVWSIDVPSTSNGGSQLKIYLPSVMRNH